MLSRWIKFIYVTPLLVAVHRQRKVFAPTEDAALAKIDLTPELLAGEEWKAAQNMLARIRRAVMEDMAVNAVPATLGELKRAWLERQAAESAPAWRRDGEIGVTRLLLPLETNPGVWLSFMDGGRLHFEAGSLWSVNAQVWHSMQNYGSHPVVTLFVEFAVEAKETA